MSELPNTENTTNTNQAVTEFSREDFFATEKLRRTATRKLILATLATSAAQGKTIRDLYGFIRGITGGTTEAVQHDAMSMIGSELQWGFDGLSLNTEHAKGMSESGSKAIAMGKMVLERDVLDGWVHQQLAVEEAQQELFAQQAAFRESFQAI